MTTDIELLPLPAIDSIVKYVEDYARTNVSHAIAARETEIEALRAEVLKLKADRDSWAQQAEDRVADWDSMREHAERLAEALRLYMSAGFGNSTDFCKQAEAKRAATEALYHTTARENDDD